MSTEKKEYYLWDELEVGQRFAPVEYVVRENTIHKYKEAVQETSDIYQNPKKYGFESNITPPTMAAIFVLEAFKTVPSPPGGIHAKQKFEFINPAKAGDILKTSVVIIDKYLKRGKKYVEMSSETINQEEKQIVKSVMTRIWAK